MNLTIISYSRIKHDYITMGINEYKKRLHRSLSLEIRDVSRSSDDFQQVPGPDTALLDKSGKEMNSKQFAGWLSKKINSGIKELKLVVGPDTGFSDSVPVNKFETISLSRLTFAGEVSALVLTEQLYRAYSIIQRTSYHK